MTLLKLVFLEGKRTNSFFQGVPQGVPPFNRKTKGFSGTGDSHSTSTPPPPGEEGEGTCNFLLQKWADTVTIQSSQPQSCAALLHKTWLESSAAGWRGYAVSYIITASKQITMLGPVMIVKLLSVEEYCGLERGNTLIKYTGRNEEIFCVQCYWVQEDPERFSPALDAYPA